MCHHPRVTEDEARGCDVGRTARQQLPPGLTDPRYPTAVTDTDVPTSYT